MATITDLAEKAGPIITNYNAALDRHRNDALLSDEGRRAAIAQAWLNTVDQIRAMRAGAANANSNEQRALEDRYLKPQRPLGASVSDTIAQDASYRDALARARATSADKPDELSQLLAEAEAVGDTLQARAALAIAIIRGDASAANVYIEHHPSSDADLTRLWELSTSKADITYEMNLALHLPEPSIPGELASLGEYSVREQYAPVAA